MNSENGKTSEPYRLLLNLTNKIKLKRSDMLLYQILVCTIKSHIKRIDSKYQLQRGMKNLNYLMDHILYQIFKII